MTGRSHAHVLLDAVKHGHEAHPKQIRDALIATGDLPRPLHTLRHLERSIGAKLAPTNTDGRVRYG